MKINRSNYLRLNLIISFFFLINLIFSQSGSIDSTFNSIDLGYRNGDELNNEVYSSIKQDDGKIIITGLFDFYKGVNISRIVRLNFDGLIDDTFNPGSGSNGTIYDIAIQTDGKLIIAGNFTSFNGTIKNRIARLNVDGSIDNSFNSGTVVDGSYGKINKVVIQPDGKIIIVGYFTSYNGISRNNIARLNSDGSIDNTFNVGTGTDNAIQTISLQVDGKIIIAGHFNSYNDLERNHITRLNSDGSIDISFNINMGTDLWIESTKIQSDGKIIIGGYFYYYNDNEACKIARLNTDGSFDNSFNSSLSSLSNFNFNIYTINVLSNGKIFIGGNFKDFNLGIRNNLAVLNSDGTLDDSFNPNIGANNTIYTSFDNNGKIFIGGNFTFVNGFGKQYIANINLDGSLDNSFAFSIGSGANNEVNATAIQNDGKIIIGGEFTYYNGSASNYITRLNIDGTFDNSFNTGYGANNIIRAIAIQPDGKIIVGGDFNSFDNVDRGKITRLNSDGSIDNSFNPGIGANGGGAIINTIAIQSDGKVLIGGFFTSFDGTSLNRIARLNSDGSVDNNFNPGSGANEGILNITLQNDGKIIVAGYFSTFNGVARNKIVRLNQDGSIDNTFNTGTGANNVINKTIYLTDGKILIGGFFSMFNGIFQNGISRLNGDGTVDNSFNTPAGWNMDIKDMCIQPDGKILIGGAFTYTIWPDISSQKFLRLNQEGLIDSNFNVGLGASNIVNTIALQIDGKIIIGGDFTSYNEVGRNRITRILNCNPISINISLIGSDILCEGQNSTLTSNIPENIIWSTGQTTQSINVSSSGSYFLTHLSNGCPTSTASASNVITVTVNPLPNVSITTINDICDTADIIVFNQGSPSGGTYTINSEEVTSFDPSTSIQSVINVSYTVTQNGCSNSTNTTFNILECSGVGLNEIDSKISFYPNPTNGKFKLLGINQNEVKQIDLYDYNGKLLQTFYNNNLDISSFSDGMYYIKVSTKLTDVINTIHLIK